MDNRLLQLKLTAVQNGDMQAFAAIYEAMQTPLYTVILRIVCDQTTAEDVLQELFVKLHRAPPSHAKNPRAYIFQMARHLAIDSLRTRKPAADVTGEELSHSPIDSVAEQLDIAAAMQALPAIDGQIVSLHIDGALKFREIAAMLAMPLGTVLWKYNTALKRLRVILQGGAR